MTPASMPDTGDLTDTTIRSNEMELMHEHLARAQMSARLGEAQQQRRSHQLAAARRISRKAERAARQARLALARVI